MQLIDEIKSHCEKNNIRIKIHYPLFQKHIIFTVCNLKIKFIEKFAFLNF